MPLSPMVPAQNKLSGHMVCRKDDISPILMFSNYLPTCQRVTHDDSEVRLLIHGSIPSPYSIESHVVILIVLNLPDSFSSMTISGLSHVVTFLLIILALMYCKEYSKSDQLSHLNFLGQSMSIDGLPGYVNDTISDWWMSPDKLDKHDKYTINVFNYESHEFR